MYLRRGQLDHVHGRGSAGSQFYEPERPKPFRSPMEHAPRDLVRVSPRSCADGVTLMDGNPSRDTMITKQLILAGCAALILSVGAAQAGPCNTDDNAASAQD